jgi:hypothetical protein
MKESKMSKTTTIYETDWVDAQQKGYLPWYSPDYGLIFEEKGKHPGYDYRRTNPIKHVGQTLTHIHSPEMFGRDEVVRLKWIRDYAGKCPECCGIMHVFSAPGPVPDSGFDVEQCFDCGYYE